LAPRYHLAAEAEHVHLVCAECGRVTQVGPDAVQVLVTTLAEHHGFETDVGHLTVFGRCADCQRAGPGGQSAGTPHHTA
jgi:Fur family ferric uptake transcriptional regulator